MDIQSKEFENEYVPQIDTLGVKYHHDGSIFRIWAPLKNEVNLCLENEIYKMERKDKGVYEIYVCGDLKYKQYHYEIGKEKVFDPFSYCISSDELNSYVIDINDFKIIHDDIDNSNPIIYETSVRDFSSIGKPFKYPMKLKGLIEKDLKIEDKTIGLDYLKELGITHLQLMPILNFDNDNGEYNWGYNPISYNSFKQDYFINEDYRKITELQDVIHELHNNGIGVILDVVYNHVYDDKTFVLNKLCPNYFYRYDKNGELYKGTGCGNELRTESKFLSDYLVMMSKRLVEIYDIDGLRFDLSGFIDINTSLKIKDACLSIKKNLLFIGEGWDIECGLDSNDRTTKNNYKKIEGFKFFNDSFKNVLKGKDDELGFIYGNYLYKNETMDGFNGNLSLDSDTTVNYVECHDDYTFYDFLNNKMKDDCFLLNKIKLSLGFVLLSRGTPFIHSGEEFLRTKLGVNNSYNLPDIYNKVDWNLRVINDEYIEYLKALISIRKKYKEYYKKEFILEHYYEVFVARIDDLVIFINSSVYDHVYNDGTIIKAFSIVIKQGAKIILR